MGRRWVLAKAGKTMKGEQHALIQAMRGVRGLIGGREANIEKKMRWLDNKD